MTHLDYNLDTAIWIGVPADVGQGGPSPDQWADWVVAQYAAESDPTDEQRDWLAQALTALAEQRDPDATLIVFAPHIWGSLSAVTVHAGMLEEPVRTADIAGVEVTDDVQRHVEPIASESLGTGMRFTRFVDDGADGLRGVVVYAFVLGLLAVRVSASDYDLNRLGVMTPYIDELVQRIRVIED